MGRIVAWRASARAWAAVVLAVAIGFGAVVFALPGEETDPPRRALVRVDQAGYAVGQVKRAFLMGPDAALRGARFRVVELTGEGEERGRTVLEGRAGARTGGWNRAYGSVRTVDLTALDTPGAYRVELTGAARGASPAFHVAPARRLMNPLLKDGVRFFQAQRDGAEVLPGVLRRRPSHLADRRAAVYAAPRYDEAGEELLDERLRRDGGPVDASGGWFDAGDFLKFTHTTSYAVAELLIAQRSAEVPGLAEEADHGLAWLDRMWDGDEGTLYAQVGIGVGNEGVRTDHDVWRLPEADDAARVPEGDPAHLVADRPVFRAADPGEPVSPNLAGRTAAAFALAAQREAPADPDAAAAWLDKAAAVYEQADTEHRGELVTAFPHAFYPEDVWQDDMEFGAAELALAAGELGDRRAERWRREAADWADAYLGTGGGPLGVADVGALAHADLLALLDGEALRGVAPGEVADDLRRQLADGAERAARDPFHAGAEYTDFDAVPHTFGLVVTAHLYARATGDHRYDAFADRQRGWALGANAWGTSFVVGAGEVYPHCPAHQAANLAGSRTGEGDILRGAVVNGPNGAGLLAELNTFDGMRPCSADPPGGASWADFDGRGARYVDDVGAWQTSEPALDFTSTALLAFALTARDG